MTLDEYIDHTDSTTMVSNQDHRKDGVLALFMYKFNCTKVTCPREDTNYYYANCFNETLIGNKRLPKDGLC